MGLPIPGLSEALTKLDTTTGQMGELIEGIGQVITLLEEQNELIKANNNAALT